MSNVVFTDNSIKVKDAIKESLLGWLYEACGEVESQTKRNSKVGTGKTKGSYQYVVDDATMEGFIGSDYDNAIWEEFGTGEYALNEDGRKGGWYVLLDAGGMTEAQAIIYGYHIYHGKDGKKYIFTKGKKPKRPMYKAYTALKAKLQQSCEERLGALK